VRGTLTKIEKSIEIAASPEKIYSKDIWERIPEWHSGFKTVEWTSKEKNKVGSTLHVTGEVAGIKAEADIEITEWKDNEMVAWRTLSGSIQGSGSASMIPTKVGTKYTVVIEYQLPYSIFGKMIDKVTVRKRIEKISDDALKKLKEKVEKENF
jgi:uncharacterized membrane protein